MNYQRLEQSFSQGGALTSSDAGGPIPRQRVVMLVANPCVNDSRVIRAAESVAEEGHEVIVLATKAKGTPDTEVRNGVVYRRCGIASANNVVRAQGFLGQARRVAGTSFRVTRRSIGAAHPRRIRTMLAPLKRRISPTPLGAALKKGRALWKRHRKAVFALGLALAAAWLAFVTLRDVELAEVPVASALVIFGLGMATGIALMAVVGSRLVKNASRKAVPKKSKPGRFSRVRPMALAKTTRSRFDRAGKNARQGLKKAARFASQGIKSHIRVAFTSLRCDALFRHALQDLKPDVIHAHDFATLPVASKVARGIGAVCIYDSHELETHRNIKRSRLDRWLCEELERRYIKRVDGVITVCDSIADHLADHYGICRPTVIMNAPSFAAIKEGERDVRSDLKLPDDTPLAIYVGAITIGRGIETIVHALQNLPDFHLVLVGPANKAVLEGALEMARKDGTADRLHVLPPVPPSSVVSYVRTADVSLVLIQNVCLSYYYCLPNKLVESTIAGLPVVASDFPELRKFVEKTGTGVVTNERDAGAIAEAIRDAYARRHELRPDEARKSIIEQHYGWETQRRKLVGLYAALLDAREPAAQPSIAQLVEQMP